VCLEALSSASAVHREQFMAKPKVKVKICGITNWADARRACEAGADFLGFNFHRPSPRYIAPAKARRIVRRLPANVAAVGVFVNEPEERMLKTARAIGLRGVQLHGDETPALVARLRRSLPRVRVIKAIRVRKTLRPEQLNRFGHASAILLDRFDGRHRGGTGKKFDWSLVSLVEMRARIFLAGGLTAENVAEAIRAARPYAIDVCSGVESAPGRKDAAKITALMRAIKRSGSAGKRK
jgi:phosphoribosylanthranilate isomerase